MKKFLLILTVLLQFKAQAQLIKGQLLEQGTNLPVANAFIYFNGSTTGTVSDKTGHFVIKSMGSNKIPIMVSPIGYNTYTIENYSESEPVQVILERKIIMLDEVVIGDDGMSREDKISAFKAEYLGSSDIAKSCEIENVDDINLRFNKVRNTLTATSTNPIIIYNKALGYRITSFLDNFVRSTGTVSYRGNQIFEADSTVADNDPAVMQARENAYLGSRMHFFRALWADDLAANGYTVTNTRNKVLGYRDLVTTESGEKYMNIRGTIIVRYKNRVSSIMSTTRGRSHTFIDITGFFDSTSIRCSGDMGIQRIGDALPFTYVSQLRWLKSVK